MPTISYIETSAVQTSNSPLVIPTDETVGAMLFDLSGFDNPFNGHMALYNNFKDGTLQCIHNMDEAVMLGISDDGFLNGMLYYHLKQFYDFIGGNQELYIAMADCSHDWSVIQNIQQQSNGKLFHVGVWTTQPIWMLHQDGGMGFTSLITDLQGIANEINGRVGEAAHSLTPLSIVLFGNSRYIEGGEIKWKEIPDATVLNCPKVSVVFAQNGSEEVHNMEKCNPLNAPVTSLGVVMACLASTGAEESIARVQKCDLNIKEQFNYPEWGVGADDCPIENVNAVWADVSSLKGYIFPVTYEGMEASYFLSSDQTLCEGDYSTIANNRVMHKCRRATGTALLPYINSSQIVDSTTKSISSMATLRISDSINRILSSVMLNKSGNEQINGKSIEFVQNAEFLDNDSLSIRLSIKPASYSSFITEEVSHNVY